MWKRSFGGLTAAIAFCFATAATAGPCDISEVQSDPSGDASVPNAAFDIESLRAGEPVYDGADHRLTLQLKVEDLSELPPNAHWTISYTVDNARRFASMESTEDSVATGNVIFNHGRVEQIGSTGNQVTEGEADELSNFDPDGTITLVLSAEMFGEAAPGETLTALSASTQQLIGASATGGLLLNADSTEEGSYMLDDSGSCGREGTDGGDDGSDDGDDGDGNDDGATAGNGEAQVVVAVIDSAINPYHDFFHQQPVRISDELIAAFDAERVTLTMEGNFAQRLEADRDFWDSVEAEKNYYFEGTNIIARSEAGAGVAPLIPSNDKSSHGVAVSSAVLTANPEAVILFIETEGDLGNDDAESYAFDAPAVDMINTSYGFQVPLAGAPLPLPLSSLPSFRGVVENGKLHFSSAGNGVGVTAFTAYPGPWWAIGVSGFEEGSSEGDTQVFSNNAADFVSDFTQDLPNCMECTSGTSPFTAGTSFSSPRAAGVASSVLLEARRLLGHGGGIDTDAEPPLMAAGHDFEISNWFLRRALEQAARIPGIEDYDPIEGVFDLGAVPVNPVAPWAQIGWGDLSADPQYEVVEKALIHLELKPGETRAKDFGYCDFQTAVLETRWEYWNFVDGRSFDESPLVYCGDSAGIRPSNDPGGNPQDSDGDGTVDRLDECPDDPEDNCAAGADEDRDGDGVPDSEDNCPDTPNPDQADSDGDGIGDACDLTATLTASPNPADATEGQADVMLTAMTENSGPGTLSYTFYFGDGTDPETTSSNSVTHTYPQGAARYTAHVVVVEGNNENSTSATTEVVTTSTVTVEEGDGNEPVSAQLQVDFNNGRRAPAMVTFDASGSTAPDGATYRFDFGDGSEAAEGTETTVSHSYSQPGTYTASVTVIDPDDEANRDSAAASITIVPAPRTTAQLVVSPTTAKVGETVTFDASGSSPADDRTIVSYTFDFDDGSDPVSQAEPMTTHAYAQTGSYQPSVTVEDSEGTTHQSKLSVRVREDGDQRPDAGGDNGVGAGPPAAEDPRRRSSGSGSPGAVLLLLAGLLLRRRTRAPGLRPTAVI